MLHDCHQNNFCASLSAESCEYLCQHCSKTMFRKDTKLYNKDLPQQCALILDGLLFGTTQSRNGGILPLGLLSKDDFFNADDLFSSMPGGSQKNEENIAITDCSVAIFPHHAIMHIFETFQQDARFVFSYFMKQTSWCQRYSRGVYLQ